MPLRTLTDLSTIGKKIYRIFSDIRKFQTLKDMNIIRWFFTVNVSFILFSCNTTTNGKMDILPLDPYFKVDSVGKNTKLRKFYLVKGFDRQLNFNSQFLKNYGQQVADSFVCDDRSCLVLFYRKSNSINEDYKETSADLIEWHINELIMSIAVDTKRNVSVMEFKDGKLINPSSIEEKALPEVQK